MIRLYLVRHGHCERPANGGMLGQRDLPLTELGLRQAQATAGRLRDVRFAAAWSSDLKRAEGTALAVLAGRPPAVRLEPRLREFDIGAWEGLPWPEIEARFPGAGTAYSSEGFAFPDGESLAAVAGRAGAALAELRQEVGEGEGLVVGHFGVLAVLLARALGLPEWGWRRFTVGHASISVLEYHDGEPLLVSLNDRTHLEGIEDAAR
jgi:broad specificity phosphatase PhoE